MESVEGYQTELASFRTPLGLARSGWRRANLGSGIGNELGLKPLGALAEDLEAIESGKRESLSADYLTS